MRRWTTIVVMGVISFCAVCCAEKASPEELKEMCGNLVKLRGKINIPTIEALTKEAEEEYQKEQKRLTDWMNRDLEEWDMELKAGLDALESPEEKAALTKEYEKKKEVTRNQHLPGIEALDGRKDQKVKEAKTKAEAGEGEWKRAVDECLAVANKESTTKKVATCRIGATSTDQYWNLCN